MDDRPTARAKPRRKELVTRLLTGQCELCETHTEVEIHQVRTLAELTTQGRPQPEWARIMAAKRRKTLMVCALCHDTIHQRHLTAAPTQ